MNACKRQLAGAACIAVLMVSGCKGKPKEAATAAPQDPNVVAVTPALAGNLKFGTPQTNEVRGTLQVVAHIDSDARRVARVGSPVAGRILRLVAFEGQTVRAGQVLATLHSTDLSDAQMQLIKADSQQNLAAAGVKRARQLVEAEVIGRAELERREAEQVQAATDVASYRTQLRGLGMGDGQIRQLEANHRIDADYPIVAPRSGVVLKREVTVGQVVQPADLAFTIADLSSVWIVANVPEEDAGTLRPGMPVSASIPALPQEQIQGMLSYVSPVVDPATRTVVVRMDMPNRNGLLKPDELANMTLTGHTERKLTVPNTAVVREENKDYVFVQTGPGRCVLREVALGLEEDDRRVVQSGVTATDTIVLDGAFHLNNQRKQAAIKGGH